MKLKMKQILSRILVFAMVVTGVPVAAMNGAGVQDVLADETGSGTQEEAFYRYRAIPDMKATADWDEAENSGVMNLLEDNMNWAMSRFNTGNKPISTYFSAKNNIFIKVTGNMKKVSSLRYYPRTDGQDNGSIIRMNVYAITGQAPDSISADSSWTLIKKDVKFDLENPSSSKTVGTTDYDYYGVEFDEALEDVAALRLEVLNSGGDYDGERSSYENDKYISGTEVEVYSEGETQIGNADLEFSVDFKCQNDSQNVSKLCDGDFTTKMHSSWNEDDMNGGLTPNIEGGDKFISNNNMYFELPEETLVGRLTYVAGAPNGSIGRARIYVATAQAPDGEGPEALPKSAWTKVYDNTAESVEEWGPYVRSGGISVNDHIADFDAPAQAKYVRLEAVMTHFGEQSEFGGSHQPDNKWISGRRVYIYAAEKVEEIIENIASKNEKSGGLKTTVKAYTGGTNPENVIDENTEILTNRDGVGIEIKDIDRDVNKIISNNIDEAGGAAANGGTTWTSGVLMKQSGYNKPAIEGAASCIVLDLGEGTASEIENIRIRWWNWLSATDYLIETSETCGLSGDLTTDLGTEITVQKIRDKDQENGDEWRTVASITNGYSEPNPLHEFNKSNDGLQSTSLSRYVRILITKMSTRGAGQSPNMKEIEINGRRSKKVSTVELDWHFTGMEHADGDRTLVYEDFPRYGADFRYPAAVPGTVYSVDKTVLKVEERTSTSDPWVDVTNTAHGFYDFGKYYRITATINSSIEFSDTVNVYLVMTDGSRQLLQEAVENTDNKKSITVRRVFTPIENYTKDYTDLKAWFEDTSANAQIAPIKARYEARRLDSDSERLWNAFANAYYHMANCLTRNYVGDKVQITAPTGLRRTDFDDGKTDLLTAYNRLQSNVQIYNQEVEIGINAPVPGEKQGEANPLNKGTLTLKPEALVYESGDLPFSIGEGGVIEGNVKFPNTDSQGNEIEANKIFNVHGSTQFIMDFDLYMDKAVTKTETVIGRLNNQYGVQVTPSTIIVYGNTDGGWPQTDYTIPDEFYGAWHDIVVIYDGVFFRMYVDGTAARDTRPGQHGQLVDDKISVFGIGYNPDRRVDSNGSNHSTEGFSGKLRNVQMFIQQGGENDDFPKWQGAITAQTPQEQETALRTLLDDENIEAELEIGGDPTQLYNLKTKWTPQHETFQKYEDYTLEVTATTIAGYEFKDNPEASLSISGQSPYAASEVAVTSQGPDSLTITYTFKHPKHPVEDLDAYLAGLDDELKTDSPDKNEKTTEDGKERVYTKATWEDYIAEYEKAVALSERSLEVGTEADCTKALTDLRAAVGNLKEAKTNCECTITGVSLTGKTISLTGSSAEETLNASYTTNDSECLKHSGTNKATATIVYTIEEDEEEIGTIEGDTLTVTGEGTVKVTATATLESGDAMSATDPAVYTVESPKVDKEAQEAKDLQTEYDSVDENYTESDYTSDTWEDLQEALQNAKDLLDRLDAGEEIPVYLVTQAMDAIDAAKKALRPAGSTEPAESVKNLTTLVDAIGKLNAKDYTTDSWKAMDDLYKKALAELAKDTPDPDVCATLLTQLQKAKDNLKPASGGTPVVKDGDPLTGTDKTEYKVVNAKEKTVTITKGVDAKTINVGPTVVINGVTYKVVGIENKAYAGLKNVTKVVIGDNVASIGNEAFTNCAKLKNVTIGKDVTTIGKKAFFKCKKLSKVTVKNNSKLSKVQGSAFKKTAKNIKIKLPKNLKKNKKLKKQIKKAGIKKGV